MENRKKIFIIALAATQVLLIIGMAVLMVQNINLSDAVKQYVSSTGDIHEIYDDSAVVAAYKSGDADGLNEQDKYVLEEATKIIEENITDDMSDYEKEKAIYDWQVAYVAYNDQSLAPISAGDQYSHTPYGVLKYHQAICVGNATTFKLFMDLLDIENLIIHSTSEGEHAWNLVNLDGDWYHSDVTFDGGSNGQPKYAYFNVPDTIKDNGSYPWDHNEIPSAEGTKYCYIANEAADLEDIYDIPEYINKQLQEENPIVAFTLKNSDGYTQSVADYIASAFAGSMDMYVGATMPIGSKNIYTYEIYDSYDEPEMGDDANQEIIEKLQEIIDGLQ